MPGDPDGLTAILLQLAGITQKLAELDQRQASDARDLHQRTATLASLVDQLKDTTTRHTVALAALDGLTDQVADLAATVAGHIPSDGGDGPAAYQPSAPPRWWKPAGPAQDAAVGKLRAWVEQVYRPGYGHLAASLGVCWEQHPLCLYILDWLSELWSVLYLAPARTAGTLAGQAEWHTRLLAAAADQLARETRGCGHAKPRYRAAPPGVRP